MVHLFSDSSARQLKTEHNEELLGIRPHIFEYERNFWFSPTVHTISRFSDVALVLSRRVLRHIDGIPT